MNRPASDAVEVELLEEDLDRSGALDGPPAEWRPLAARVPRPAWWAVTAVGAVVVAGVTVAGHLEDEARAARLAGVAGLSAPLGRPLEEAWRVPGSEVLGAVAGTVVIRGPRGATTLAAELRTGVVRWSRDGACELVAVGDDPRVIGQAPVQLEDRPDDLLVCVEQLRTGGVDGGHVLPMTAHVVAPATGELVRSIDLGPRTAFSTVGADLVSMGIGADGHAEAARWSLLTGDLLWTYRSPDVLPPNDSWGSSIDGSVVQLDIGPWTLTLDADTGERIARLPVGARGEDVAWGPLALPDGASAVSRFDAVGSTRTSVREADGSTRVTVPGLLLLPTVDDGSAPDRLFVVRDDDATDSRQVAAVDPGTGATRWQSTAPVGRTAVVQGLLLVRDDAGVTALDARTGAVRWSAAAGGGATSGGGMVTDGRRVLVLERAPGGTSLVARDVVTGATAWARSVGVTGGAALALLPDGAVVATGRDELVVLRPPP